MVEADKRVQRLETEAKTISKLVMGETKNLWPPIIDGVSVAKGFEKALGAALGDDLDAPIEASAPMRWTNLGVMADDPALPGGVESLATHVNAPPELARRLAQIGIVSRERTARSLPRNSRPDSGWCLPKATCGAGTGLSPARTPPTGRGAASGRTRTAYRHRGVNLSRRVAMPPPSAARWKRPRPI